MRVIADAPASRTAVDTSTTRSVLALSFAHTGTIDSEQTAEMMRPASEGS